MEFDLDFGAIALPIMHTILTCDGLAFPVVPPPVVIKTESTTCPDEQLIMSSFLSPPSRADHPLIPCIHPAPKVESDSDITSTSVDGARTSDAAETGPVVEVAVL